VASFPWFDRAVSPASTAELLQHMDVNPWFSTPWWCGPRSRRRYASMLAARVRSLYGMVEHAALRSTSGAISLGYGRIGSASAARLEAGWTGSRAQSPARGSSTTPSPAHSCFRTCLAPAAARRKTPAAPAARRSGSGSLHRAARIALRPACPSPSPESGWWSMGRCSRRRNLADSSCAWP